MMQSSTEDLEQVIEKSETSSSSNSDELIKPPKTIRERLDHVIHTGKFQLAILSLVVIDCVLVLAELLIDLKVFENEAKIIHNITVSDDSNLQSAVVAAKESEKDEKSKIIAAEVLHYCSIAILSLFILELGVKLFAMGKKFFTHKMEIVDGFIIIVSFALDVALIEYEGISAGIGLLIVLRLWRIGRIVNGVVLSVKTQSDKRLAKEKTLRQAAEAELRKFKEYCSAQEREIEALQLLLKSNNISFQKMSKPHLPISTIDVVAEVNQYIEANRISQTDSLNKM